MARSRNPIVEQIVGRIHVGESHLTAAREVKQAMKKGAWAKLDRATRSNLIDDALQAHTANREVYRQVMGGSYR
jgi:acyl-CoA reductase-like NAD-dependent aldehyde dehydrogenase